MDIVALLKEQPDLYTMNAAIETEILQAEQTLGLRFSTEYREYVSTFGVASFDGHELTGVCKSDRLNVVAVTIKERSGTAVPDAWYVLEQTNMDGIVIWQDADGAVYLTMPNSEHRKICKSLAEYISM